MEQVKPNFDGAAEAEARRRGRPLSGRTPAQVALRRSGLTVTELARRVHASIPYTCEILSGRRESKFLRVAVAAALGRTPRELWGDDWDRRPGPARLRTGEQESRGAGERTPPRGGSEEQS